MDKVAKGMSDAGTDEVAKGMSEAGHQHSGCCGHTSSCDTDKAKNEGIIDKVKDAAKAAGEKIKSAVR